MNVGNVVLLTGITGGIIELIKGLLPKKWIAKSQVLVALCIVASFGATYLLRYSVWAHETLIGDKVMDTLSVPSLAIVAISLAGFECASFLVLKGAKGAVSNVGDNQPVPAPQTSLTRYGAPQ